MKTAAAIKGLFKLALLTSISFSAVAGPFDTWKQRHPSVPVSYLNGVAYGNGNFVAAGSSGFLTSTNGASWTAGPPVGFTVFVVAYGTDRFLAFGEFGAVFSSPDGYKWSQNFNGTWTSMDDITYANGRFVGIGHDDLEVCSSTWATADGTNFLEATPAQEIVLHGICYGDGVFVAVGESGTVLASSDGTHWTNQPPATTNKLLGVTFGNGTFVAVGAGGVILTSSDLLNWTARDSGTRAELRRAFYQGGEFFTVGGDSGSLSVILRSRNAVDWAPVAAPTCGALFGITWGNGEFVSVGEPSTILSSVNGADWIARGSLAPFRLLAATYDGSRFVVVGDWGTILSSLDGVEWQRQNSGTTQTLFSVVSEGGITVAVGGGGAALTSTNESSWVVQSLGSSAPIRAVAYGNDRFLAIGGAESDGSASTWSSMDGVNWSQVSRRSSTDFLLLAFGNGMFMATVPYGPVLTSSNGIDWTTVSRLESEPAGLTYGRGRFVAVLSDWGIYSTPDGKEWTLENGDVGPASIGYGDGCFVATRHTLAAISEEQGVWTYQSLPVGMEFLGRSAYGNGTFLLVGPYGFILQSGLRVRLIPSGPSQSGFDFTLIGQSGLNYRIETSQDLNEWALWTNILSTSSSMVIRDSNPTKTHRFYRAVYP